MDAGKIGFFLFTTLVSLATFVIAKNKLRSLLMISAFVFIFPIGWIFYHFNGIWVADIPLLLLIFYGFSFGHGFKWYFPKISFVILGSLVWALISAVSAPEAGWAVSQATVTLRAYLIFVAVMNTLKTPKDLYYVTMAILAGFTFESFLGFWQWRFGPVGLTFLGERVYMYDWRSMGTFFVTSYYGNYLILLIPLAYRLFIYHRPFRKWETYAYGGMTLLSVFALFSTYGRGPWISVIIALGLITLFSFLNKKHRPRVKWAIGLIIVFGFAFGVKYTPVIIDQFGPQRQAAADVRKDEWRTALRVIKNNLIWGTGPGNYENLSVNYVTAEEVEGFFGWQIAEMVHNSYLLVTAETGILGGILFVSWFLLIFKQTWKTAKLQIPYFRNLGIGIGAGFFALAISFYYSPDIHEYQIMFMFWLLTGILFSLDRLELKCLKQYKQAQMKRAAPSAPQQAIFDSKNLKEVPL